MWPYLALFFAVAVASDWLTVVWHRHRESGSAANAIAVGCVLQAVAWVPLVAAIDGRVNVWLVAAVDVAGAAVGIAIGMRGR